jgi:hypothetical protein
MTRFQLFLSLPLALSLAAIACEPKPSPAPEQPEQPATTATTETTEPLPAGVLEGVVSTTSTVKAIDQESRMVTLTNPDGTEITFRAGDQVRNLAEVQVGDEVSVQYYESIAYQVKKADADAPAPATTVESATIVAPLGGQPGGEQVQVTTVTATIVGIDKPAGTVSLQQPEGPVTTVPVRDPANLDLVQIGDLVEITLTEAVAISVERPAS